MMSPGVCDESNVLKAAYVLFAALFTVNIGQSILGPVLPPLVRELGLSELQGGLIITVSSLMWVLFSAWWGRRSEVWGRKPVFMLALAGYSLGVGVFGLVIQLGLDGIIASSLVLWPLMIGSRMIVGTLYSGSIPSAQAYIADTTSGQQRNNAMGIISAAQGLGTIFGPALGAAAITLGLVAPIFLSALLPLGGVLLAYFLLKPIEPAAKRGQKLVRLSPFESRIWPLLTVGVVVTTILAITQFTIAFLFQDRLHLDTTETAQAVGLALVASGIAALFVQMVLIRLLRLKPFTMLLIGLPFLILMALLLVFGDNMATLTLALICQGLGVGLAMPGYRSGITYVVTTQEQGAAAGLASSIGGMGYIAGPALGTALYDLNPSYPYLLAIVVLLLGLLVLLSRRRVGMAQSPV